MGGAVAALDIDAIVNLLVDEAQTGDHTTDNGARLSFDSDREIEAVAARRADGRDPQLRCPDRRPARGACGGSSKKAE